jgi:hypothetical protein
MMRPSILAALVGLSLLLPAAAEVEEPRWFAVEFEDGQRVTGSLEGTVQLESDLGLFKLPIEVLLEARRVAPDRYQCSLSNGDVITGAIKKELAFHSENGPPIRLPRPGWVSLTRDLGRLSTAWSEPAEGLLARLRIDGTPRGRRGQLLLSLEVQNMTKEALWLLKPRFLDRLPEPSELRDAQDHDAWITAAQEAAPHLQQRLGELERLGEFIGLKPGGIYRMQVTVPWLSGGRGLVEEMADVEVDRGEELREIREPQDLVVDLFGTDTLQVSDPEVQFRGYFRCRAGRRDEPEGTVWKSAVVTPVLTVPFR